MKRVVTSCAFVVLMGSVPLMTACADRDTATVDYAERVNDSLKTANIDDVKADWKADEKTLHLSGEVERAADKARAEQLASQVVGTSGRVVNEVKVEGTNAGETDDRIEEQLGKMFEDRTEWDFDGRGVTFDSEAGVVTITGTVESQAVKDRIGTRAKATPGVTDVVNNLEVKPRDRQ